MIEKSLKVNGVITIEDDNAHHIIDVLRLRHGDWIVLSDGKGGRFRAEIQKTGKKLVTALIQERLPDIAGSNITLAQAVIKHDRIESIIQRAVELGVAKIIPFTSERTIPRFSKEAHAKKAARWNRIALEAAKQSGLSMKPVVRQISPLKNLLENSEKYDQKLLFYEGEANNTLQEYFAGLDTQALKNSNTLVLIGPEGGFADDEVELAREHGFAALKLGPLILRVETATTAALALVQYFLGHE